MNTTNGITIESYNGFAISVRQPDTYIDGTALCRANRKQIGHWFENKQTQEFLDALSDHIGIPIDPAGIPMDPSAKPINRNGMGLIFHVMSGPNEHRGTFVHPRVAIHLAQWASPKCAVWVTDLVYRYMAGETLNAKQDAKADPHTEFWSNIERLRAMGATPTSAVYAAAKLLDGQPLKSKSQTSAPSFGPSRAEMIDCEISTQRKTECEIVFQTITAPIYYNSLLSKIVATLGVSIPTAQRRIRRWVSMDLLKKTHRGYRKAA